MPPTSHFLKIHLNIFLPSTPGSPKWSLSLRFPHRNPVYTSSLPHTCYMPPSSYSFWFYHAKNYLVGRETLRKASDMVDCFWKQSVLWVASNGLLGAAVFVWIDRRWRRKALRLYTRPKIVCSLLTCVSCDAFAINSSSNTSKNSSVTKLQSCFRLNLAGTCVMTLQVQVGQRAWGRDSSVGIATWPWLDGLRIETWWKQAFPHPSRPASCKLCTCSLTRGGRGQRDINLEFCYLWLLTILPYYFNFEIVFISNS